MKKKSRREPIVLPSSVEAAAGAKANRGQAIAKKATIGFASVVGAAALYYCLIPALAQDGGTEKLYVFFDNGLSQYEGLTDGTAVVYGEVYESEADESADKLTMMRLSDVETSNTNLWNAVSSQLGGNFDNINTDNVYVSTEPVTVGNYVSFTGYDSGTVYDTVTNYRVNAASREWGYDYVDFQWTSDPTVLTEASTCYYAPPQMMMNRYGAEAATEKGGTKTMVQLIYEHGDSKGDSSSKPEVTGSWVNPQNAEGRTFYDAVFIMKGMFGDVHGINELGYESQSYYTEDGDGNIGYETLEGSVALNGDGDNGLGTAKLQYPAKATFFDYFSDWELAGNPIEDHEISYTYNNADGNDVKDIWEMSVDYTATAPITAVFPTGDFGGFTNVGTGDSMVFTAESDRLNLNGGAIAEYKLPSDATGAYYNAVIYAQSNTSHDIEISATLYYELNGTAYNFTLETIDGIKGTWVELDSGSFYIPEGAENAAIRYSGAGNSTNFRLDDFTLRYEGTGQTTITYATESATETAKFPAGDFCGFYNVGSGILSVADKSDHTGDGSQILQFFNKAVAKYDLPYATGKNISVSAWVKTGASAGTMTSTLHYKDANGVEQSVQLNQVTIEGAYSAWSQLISETVSLPDGATDIYIKYDCGNINFYLDDFSITYEKYTLGYSTIASADFASGYPADYNFSTVDVAGDNNGKLSIDAENGRLYSFYHQPAVYTMPTDLIKAGNYKFSMKITDTQYELRNAAVLLAINGGSKDNYTTLTTLAIDDTDRTKESGTWHTLTGEFTIPEDATSVQLYFQTFDAWYTEWDSSMYTDSAYYDDFNLQREGLVIESIDEQAGPVTATVNAGAANPPTTGANGEATKGYADYVGVNLENKSDLVSDSIAKIYLYAETYTEDGKTVIPLQGQNTYSNKETYLLEGKVFSTSKVRVRARHFKSQNSYSDDDRVGEDQILGTYEPGSIFISENFNPPLGAGSTLIFVEPVDDDGNVLNGAKVLIDYMNIGLDLIDIEGSFAEGSNSIAYSYQGSLFNDAISTYYDNADADPDATVPLYFGSNSWMTGNMRYYHYESRTPQFLFNLSEIAKALANVGCETSLTRDDYINTSYTDGDGNTTTIWADGKKGQTGQDNKGAYIIPASREYWRTLFGYRYNTYDELTNGATEQELMGYFRNNTALGFSNSRAVENLVWDQLAADNTLGLDGTTIESPYFNEEFLRGENDANAAYGTVYNDVDFAFAFNEDTGYYEYDSTRAYYATRLTERTNGGYYMDYYNYDQLVTHLDEANEDGNKVVINENSSLMGVKKADGKFDDGNGSSQTVYQYYPFNSPDTNDRFATENLMFAMKLDIPFNMYSAEEKRNNSMFKFSGDDDVWVYVDGKQVLDIGGTHTAVGGFIDLKNGYGIVGSSYSNNSGLASVDSTSSKVYHHEISTKGESGTDQGVTTAEKAAFALLASLEEINFIDNDGNYIDSADLVTYLKNNTRSDEGVALHATPWTNGLGISDWNKTKTSVNFFDDTFVVNDTTKQNGYIAFEYRARLADDGQLLIDVKARNVKADTDSDDLEDRITDLDGETVVDWVDATFVMTQFELAESTEELSDHTLSVYYMERGLNSSNFKMAFNFVPNAQKQVQKLWADGNETHDEHSTDQDYVDVELWRTEPQRTTLTDADVSIPEGYSLVRAVSHNSKTDTGTANSTFISDSSQVTVQYELQDAAVADSAVTLSLNSVPISLEAYKQFNSGSLKMQIYINDNLVSTGNGDSVVDDYEFFEPAADYVTAYPTDGVGGQSASVITDEQKCTAIKIPASDNKSNTIVKIVFKQRDAAADPAGNADTQFNTWGMVGCDAWLIDAYAFNNGADDSDTSTDPSIGIASGSVFGTGMTESVTSTTSGYTLNADEMQFAISRAVRYRNSSYYMSNYIATAIMPKDGLKLAYTNTRDRALAIWTGEHTNIFNKVTYTIDETYNGDPTDFDYDLNNPAVYTIKTTDTTGDPNKVLMVTVGGKSHVIDDIGYGITYTATNTFDTIVYSNPYKVNGSSIRLDSSVDWTHLWDNVAESVTLGDETLDYKYFIREISASSEHGTELSDYQTLYYDAKENGNLIQPTVVTDSETGEEMTLYSIDDTGYVQIVNNPITSAQIKKEWAVKDDSDMINIVVTLYGEDSKAAGAVTVVDEYLLSADNNYTVDLSSLPMYNPETGGKWKYYAAESISAKYTASYSTEGIKKTISGTTDKITVYPLAEAEAEGEPLTLTVTNQVEGFVLEINKVDEEGTTALEGAEFVLYEQNTDGSWAIVTKSVTEEESEETETASVDSDSDSDAVAAASMNVVGNSYTGNSSVSNFGAQQVLGATITEDVYYNFSDSTHEWADYFTITGFSGDNIVSSSASYNGKTLTTAMKMGSGQYVTFTTSGACDVTLFAAKNGDTGGLKITKDTKDGSKIDSCTVTETNAYKLSITEAGTYVICRDDGQHYLYYIDIDVHEVTPGMYYDFSKRESADVDNNEYAKYFAIEGATNDNLITFSNSIAYVDSPNKSLTKGLKMGSGQKIKFTTSSAMFLTLVIANNKSDDTLTISKLNADNSTYTLVSTIDEIPKRPIHIVELKEAGTYLISRKSGQPYLSHLDFSTYNKYDAENFNKTLGSKVSTTWFTSANEECFTLADELVNLQITSSTSTWGLKLDKNYGYGGWQKDPDYYTDAGSHWYHATIDNNVTTAHIRYLAKAYQCATDATKKAQYKASVEAGIQCLLDAQYDNGGWPSVFENSKATDECGHDTYHNRITYNDSAMTKVMELLLEVRDGSNEFTSDLVSTKQTAAGNAIIKGVDCILKTQIKINGVKTAWCQQHYETGDLLPAPARAHELESISASESVGIIEFLQKIADDENTDATTRANAETSADAAVAWLKSVAIYDKDVVVIDEDEETGTKGDRYLVTATDSTTPIWSRFYAIADMSGYDANNNAVTIKANEPFFVNRVSKDDMTETEYGKPISITNDDDWLTVYSDIDGMHDENARNYAWYGTWGTGLISTDSGSDDTGSEVDLTGTLISNVHVYDTENSSDWSIYTDLQLGELVYGDRDEVTYTTLPDALVGAEYVRTACDSKNYTNDLATLTAAENIDVYVALDKRVTDNTVPSWLSGWTATGLTATSSNDVTFNLYKKSVAANETITLGSNGQPSGCVGYTVMAVASTEEATTTTTTTTITTTTTTVSIEETPAVTTAVSSDSDTTIPSNAMLYITNSNGRVNIGGLQPGTYKLVETKAPLGYVALVDEIVFTVGATADEAIDTSKITYTPNDGTNVTMAWDTSNPDKLTIVATIRNKFYAITMPNTGARGVYPVFIGSALFAAAAFAGGMMRRRNKKR